jgi:hypothetical protein
MVTGLTRLILVVFVVLSFCWSALPAAACSYTTGPELAEILSGDEWNGQIDGVFEYQHIAWTPNLWFRDERSVSIVTRYWGDPPDHTKTELHGDHFLGYSNSCPNGAIPLGTVDYGVVHVGSRAWRSSFGGIQISEGLTPALADLLEERFGPPVPTPVTLSARAGAWFLLIWQPVLFVVVVVVGSVGLVKRWRQRRHDQQAALAQVIHP